MAITPERMQQLTALAQKINANPTLRQQILGGTEQVSPTGTSDFRKPGQRPEFQQDLGSTVGQVASDIGLDRLQTAGQLTGLQGEAIKRTEEERKRRETQQFYGDLDVPEGMVVTGRTRKTTPTEVSSNTTFGYAPGVEETAKAKAKEASELGAGQRAAERTVGVMTGTLNEFAKTLAEAYDTGQIGDLLKATKTAMKQKVGGKQMSSVAAANAIPGQKIEILTKFMPLLTQQGDKPGSVRLVSTVFDRLAGTIPGASELEDIKGNQVDAISARRMMAQTITNMFRFAQAIQQVGLTNEDVDNIPGKVLKDEKTGAVSVEKGSELSKVGEMIERVANGIELSEADQAMVDRLINTTLRPLDEVIAKQQQQSGGGLTAEEEAELNAINEELMGLEQNGR